MNPRIPFLWLLAGVLLFPACDEFTDVVEEDAVQVALTVRAPADERAAAVSVTVSGDALEEPITAREAVTGDTAEVVVDVPTGDLSVTVMVENADGMVYAEAVTSATVTEDMEVQVDLSLITEQVTVETAVPSHVAAASLEVTGTAIDTVREEMTVASGTASATVAVPVGTTREFRVTAFDSASIAVLRGTGTAEVTEGSAPTVTVTVSALEGDQPITGTFGGYTFTLSPGETTAGVGDTLSYTATVFDEDGAEVTGATVEWASTNPGVATVDSTGQVVAVAPGVTSIAITYAGYGVSALLTVSEAL